MVQAEGRGGGGRIGDEKFLHFLPDRVTFKGVEPCIFYYYYYYFSQQEILIQQND